MPEHNVIESKPDNTVIDLRLHAPWPQLQQFANSLDLATADDVMHKHIPYGAYLSAWRRSIYAQQRPAVLTSQWPTA